MRISHLLLTAAVLPLAACGSSEDSVRGVDHSETLLSVSASGQADTAPDEAMFQAGVQNWAASAKAASAETDDDIRKIATALRGLGVEEKDIQTSAVNVQRIDWGDRKGQFQASNTVTVRMRDIDKTGAAVTAATEVGANIVSGPDLRLSDPEKAANSAYANAYKAALARAEAYAAAADMEVSRVLYIRDAGGSQGNRYLAGAQQISDAVAVQTAPPPPVAPPPPINMRPEEEAYSPGTIMAGQTTSAVSVQVDFALKRK